MWNENRPLELLKEMPHVLKAENLAEIQQVIDNDKFVNSKSLRGDLCGRYAPFCKNCDKSVDKPCAVAFVRMKIKEGMDVEMDGIPSEATTAETEDGSAPAKKIRIAIARNRT